MRFEEVLNIIQGNFCCVINNKKYEFSSKKDFENSIRNGNYIVASVKSENNMLLFELKPWKPPIANIDSEWVKKHKEQNGSEPGFF